MATITLSIGSDHGGFELRKALIQCLEKDPNLKIIDQGTHSTDSVDYPDYAFAVSQDVVSGKADYGVLMCTTGIGISIAANKINGIRAAVVHNFDGAEFSRRHNNANIICFGGKYDTVYMAEKMVKLFINSTFDGDRHKRRIDKITAAESSPSPQHN